MNFHALSVLEFRGVLDAVAGHASSPLGAERVHLLTPVNDRRWIADEHLRVAAMRSLVSGEDAWRPQPIPDLRAALGRLQAAGGVWPAIDLLAGVTLLRSSRVTRETLKDASRSEFAREVLAPLAIRLTENVEAERSIDRAIDADAQVRDQASPELRRVRRDLRGAESELVQLLDRIMARLDPHQRVADMSVTVRSGRYVIPVRREARGSVGGIVHDESATGGTLFVEPPAAVEFGNRIRELQAHELREVDRILRELTESIRPMRDALLDSLEALVELDSLYARARLAEAFSCAQMAFVAPAEGFTIVQGRHPLLLATGATVVPFDLRMEPHERTLLLSGPNTGGKTVLLKALGLISAMAQAGIPACVGEGSRVAVFDNFFADIGDEQSIEASLSTFSAHLRNLGAVLEGATAESLVLIDELGSGTDPAEGAALGSAILENLSERGAMTVATTHLGALKLLATERPGVVNASLQFDEIALAPTYRLVKGIPGRSYGLGIARRLRIPTHVIDRAEAALPRGELDVSALLSDLERRATELAERERSLSEATERVATRLEAVSRREQELREAERLLERQSRSEARQHLLEARKEVEELVRGLRASPASDDTLRDARRRIESLASEHAKALERLEQDEVRNEIAGVAAKLEIGDLVAVETLGGREGRVVEIRDGEAVVAVGALKVAVPSARLRRSRTVSEPPSVSLSLSGDTPELHVASEIDLRGLRVDETERALMHTLDSAVRADLRMLRIIHGKGTGALRDRVAELLRGDVRVRSFRLGAWNEGGAGVTIAELT